ncbi:Gfo/Idh/MocA family oxidoreductase [Ktedonosporobacter rubrisoli]|uniref:Gfo/Idh/MocA family oxidoreductase n=1 Tax=Ktedonosporobacter rubrisoli TaxID=2509675 RepID=A0A4P6K2L5_KTERU|nr:Gfo/Idh/MocA family oxidoreductase [Ktedonosporobacter rubrisoli]QBD82265.1 Gfo/Idh/MocA family oxidoreductase [Ktedonosporobacter rubrisoli]
MQNDVLSYTELVRWGVISAANIGVRAVSPAIHASSNGRLVAVGSRDPQRAAELYAFAPHVRIYGDYVSVINDPDIDAVYIPLPNSLHAEWTIRALEAGKHVLCEKPLATTVEEGKKMLEAARANKVLLMEAFMYRFHPQVVWALEQIKAGVIGSVKLVRASFSFDIRGRSTNVRLRPELAGGSLMDIGCYPLNLCRAIYGHPPRTVAARVYAPRPGAVDMAMNAVLDFGEGRFGLIDSSFELARRQMAEIVGDEGSITIPVPFTPGDHAVAVFVTKGGNMNEQSFTRVDQYRLEVEHFANCIRTGQEPEMSLNETLENLATIEAIYQAAGHDWPIL